MIVLLCPCGEVMAEMIDIAHIVAFLVRSAAGDRQLEAVDMETFRIHTCMQEAAQSCVFENRRN